MTNLLTIYLWGCAVTLFCSVVWIGNRYVRRSGWIPPSHLMVLLVVLATVLWPALVAGTVLISITERQEWKHPRG
jgi:integral membrane sensor domain MASE1